MGMIIEYPANKEDCYAKGNFEDGAYFEVPAIFNEDGSCNIEETRAKVEAAQIFLTQTRPST